MLDSDRSYDSSDIVFDSELVKALRGKTIEDVLYEDSYISPVVRFFLTDGTRVELTAADGYTLTVEDAPCRPSE